MLKRLLLPLTLAHQLMLIVLVLAAMGIAGMSLAGWQAQRIQGSAHAINVAGSLRMQSYRLLAAVPLNAGHQPLITTMEHDLASPELERAAALANQRMQLSNLITYWQASVRPSLQHAQHQRQVSHEIALFVVQLDALVSAFDHTTELSIKRVVLWQKSLAALFGLVVLFTIIWLRRRLLSPWRQLLSMAHAVARRDFTPRVCLRGFDEMATLSRAFNSMATELAASYRQLEQRVAEKTAGLARKNEMLSFLYQASRWLHTAGSIQACITPIFTDLQKLTGLEAITLHLYDVPGLARESALSLPADSTGKGLSPGTGIISWRLCDDNQHYGLVLARLPEDVTLSQDEHQMIETLMELLSATLVQQQQAEHHQQFIVMEERSTIARELHDSIAQSLAAMKMQVSCLQMQASPLPEESQTLLSQIRSQLDSSWRQLRELLTTFRLELKQPGLRPALEASCAEFSARMTLPVQLSYQLPAQHLPAYQAIHVVQIVREALNNSFRHANCRQAGVTVSLKSSGIEVVIWDDGCGFRGSERGNHYGLVIMRDRAESLNGSLAFRPRCGGGTDVVLHFVPKAPCARFPGESHEPTNPGHRTID